MSEDRLKILKDRFLTLVEGQLDGNIDCVDAEELGEVMDMAKDCAEAMKYCAEAKYYKTVVEAMEEADEEEKETHMREYLPEYKLARSRMFFKPEELTWDEVIEKVKHMYSNASMEDKTVMKQVIVSLGEQM